MKKLVIFCLAMALSAPAFAATNLIATVYSNYSAVRNVAITGTVFNVKNYRTKTLFITGRPNQGATTFSNYSVAIVPRCGWSQTGPFVACKTFGQLGFTLNRGTYYDKTKYSSDNGTIYSWEDASPYVRIDATPLGFNASGTSGGGAGTTFDVLLFGTSY